MIKWEKIMFGTEDVETIKRIAYGKYSFFREIWIFRDNRKELLLHVYIS